MTFHYPHTFELESGSSLPELHIEYQTWGNPNSDKVIWVCHALTANADVSDWWDGLFGKGRFLDPEENYIICANILGSCYGSTYALSNNPANDSPYYYDFPILTIRDMVSAHVLLRKHLGIERITWLMGGSLGGQQAMEWAIREPLVFEHLFLIATNAKHSPWGIAFNESQRMAIAADSSWGRRESDAGLKGMKAARAMALLSYRHYEAYKQTQSEDNNEKTGNFKAISYQRYQGEKLAKRFDAFAYWTLSRAMDSHNIGRGRESIEWALAQIQAHTVCMSISSDMLFPPAEQQFLSQHIPQATYACIESDFGHDGFLIENKKIMEVLSAKQNSAISSYIQNNSF
ncbi:MAG: homoserine O-acetyltransferase [Bernardetiaceae bacterium]|nr:homoserine O-acetyltransferase [Bernardetiaceae bacterium]